VVTHIRVKRRSQRLPFRRRSPRSHSAAGFHVNGYPDPRGALYNPTRLQTHYYLEDEHDRIQQPSTPDLQQWMRLSSKWNKQKNLPASSRQHYARASRPKTVDPTQKRPINSWAGPNNMAVRPPQSAGRRSQEASAAQGASQRTTQRSQSAWGSTQRSQSAWGAIQGSQSSPPSRRMKTRPDADNQKWLETMNPVNYQVTPEMIKENLECDRLLRTAAWESQAAETALSMSRFAESSEHLKRAATLQEAAECLSDECLRKSLTAYPAKAMHSHVYNKKIPILYDGTFSRPFNVDTDNPMQ